MTTLSDRAKTDWPKLNDRLMAARYALIDQIDNCFGRTVVDERWDGVFAGREDETDFIEGYLAACRARPEAADAIERGKHIPKPFIQGGHDLERGEPKP